MGGASRRAPYVFGPRGRLAKALPRAYTLYSPLIPLYLYLIGMDVAFRGNHNVEADGVDVAEVSRAQTQAVVHAAHTAVVVVGNVESVAVSYSIGVRTLKYFFFI